MKRSHKKPLAKMKVNKFAMCGVLLVVGTICFSTYFFVTKALGPLSLYVYDVVMEPITDLSAVRVITSDTDLKSLSLSSSSSVPLSYDTKSYNGGMNAEWFKRHYFQQFPLLFPSFLNSSSIISIKNSIKLMNKDNDGNNISNIGECLSKCRVEDGTFIDTTSSSSSSSCCIDVNGDINMDAVNEFRTWLITKQEKENKNEEEDDGDDVELKFYIIGKSTIENKRSGNNNNNTYTPLFQVSECKMVDLLTGPDRLWYLYPPGRLPRLGFDDSHNASQWAMHILPQYRNSGQPPISTSSSTHTYPNGVTNDKSSSKSSKPSKSSPSMSEASSSSSSSLASINNALYGIPSAFMGRRQASPEPLMVRQTAGTVIYIPQGFRYTYETFKKSKVKGKNHEIIEFNVREDRKEVDIEMEIQYKRHAASNQGRGRYLFYQRQLEQATSNYLALNNNDNDVNSTAEEVKIESSIMDETCNHASFSSNSLCTASNLKKEAEDLLMNYLEDLKLQLKLSKQPDYECWQAVAIAEAALDNVQEAYIAWKKASSLNMLCTSSYEGWMGLATLKNDQAEMLRVLRSAITNGVDVYQSYTLTQAEKQLGWLLATIKE